MKLRNVLLAATVLAAPVAVKAQPVTGLYVGAGAGYDYLTDTDLKSSNLGSLSTSSSSSSSSTTGKIISRGGFVGLGSVGYGLGNGFRVEIEGDYRQSHTRLKHDPGVFGGGNILQYGGMVNGLFDFDVGLPIFPYVGVGVGYGLVQPQGYHLIATSGSPNVGLKNDSKGGVAVQGILGMAYPIAGMPGLSLTAEVRGYSNLENRTFHGQSAVVPAGVKIDNLVDVSGLVGLRYAFNAAPPPPPPAPAVQAPPAAAPSRTYLVFFDWDRADLTARARQIIAEAAQNSTRVQYTRIDVSGHTDTTGSAAYNQTLSVRRAQSVAAELVKDGVPRTAIDIHGYGFSRPLVPTGPGIREPQNRRVEIVLK